MLRKGTMAYYSRLYDTLYEIGQRILANHNPCDIKDGKCGSKHGSFCCQACPHLTKNGCRAKALWCKLWLCGSKRYKNRTKWDPALTDAARKLRIIEIVAGRMLPIYYSSRCSKRKFMSGIQKRIKQREANEKTRSSRKHTRKCQK